MNSGATDTFFNQKLMVWMKYLVVLALIFDSFQDTTQNSFAIWQKSHSQPTLELTISIWSLVFIMQ